VNISEETTCSIFKRQKVAGFTETSVTTKEATQWHFTEDSDVHSQEYENLGFQDSRLIDVGFYLES
jgi:hypothetical protein